MILNYLAQYKLASFPSVANSCHAELHHGLRTELQLFQTPYMPD